MNVRVEILIVKFPLRQVRIKFLADLNGKIALVTGASRGLGLALAQALAQQGWHLIIDARGEAALTAVSGKNRPLTHAEIKELLAELNLTPTIHQL